MEANEVKRMKELEEEKNKLKRIVANLTLEIDAVKHVLEKVWRPADKREAVGMMVLDKQVNVRQACRLVSSRVLFIDTSEDPRMIGL